MSENTKEKRLPNPLKDPQRRKKILQHFLVIVGIIFLSTLIEVFGFNFHFWTMSEEERGIQNISYTTTQDKEKVTIKSDQNESFVHKLLINHTTTDKQTANIKYTYAGAYNQETTSEIERILEPLIPTTVLNLDEQVSQIEITYAKNSDLTIHSLEAKNTFDFNYLSFSFVFCILLVAYLIFLFWKDGFKTEKLYLYFIPIALILGGLFIWLQPVATYYSWDDQIHFENTIDIFKRSAKYSEAEFHMSDENNANSIGRDNITSIEERSEQSNFLNTSGESSFSKEINNAPYYNKIGYIPMAVGYHGAKFLHLPFTVCFRIAKFFNLLLFILLMACAIKIARVGKRLLTVIALIPTCIFLASSFSYDPIIIAGITLFVVSLINFLVDKNYRATPKHLLIMLIPMVCACCVKAIYAPLLLLTLLIPFSRFKNKKQSYFIKGGIIAICFLLLSTFLIPTLTQSTSGDIRGGNTSVSEQLNLAMSHPIDFTKILLLNIGSSFAHNFLSPDIFGTYAYVGNSFYSMDYIGVLYFIFLILLIFVSLTDSKKNSLKTSHRIAFILSIIVLTTLIWTALYLSFTPVGATTIAGVQSRYFLPLLFLLIICLQPKRINTKLKESSYNLLVLVIPTGIVILSLFRMFLIPFCL